MDTYFVYREDGGDEPGRPRKSKDRYDYTKKLEITDEPISAKGPEARRIAESLFGVALGLISARGQGASVGRTQWNWLLGVAQAAADDKDSKRIGRRTRL